MIINVNGIERRIPMIRLDGRDYFILGGTYQRLHNERMVKEQYTPAGDGERQVQATEWKRWQMTLLVPLLTSQISYSAPSSQFDNFVFGDLDSIHATLAKEYPSNGLEYYDVHVLENFSSSYTHYVYASKEWETPHGNDPGLWEIPINLWGRDS